MQILENNQYTFTAAFGLSRVGKTVTLQVLDSAGNVLSSGYTAGAVVELGNGVYGCAVSFSSLINGYFKWTDVDDSLSVFDTFRVLADYTLDVTLIRKMETNRWKITGNQLVVYDDDAVTPFKTFNLQQLGVPNGASPDERIPA